MSLSLEESEKHAEMFHAEMVKLQRFIEAEIVSSIVGQIETSDFEEVLRGLYYRMVLWGRTMVALTKPEHFQAVRSGARAAFELHLDILLLSKKPTLVEQMLAFTKVWKCSSAKKLVNFLAQNPKIDSTSYKHQHKLVNNADKTQECLELIAKFWPSSVGKGPPSDWYGTGVFGKASEAGPEFVLRYRAEYGIESIHVHSGIISIDQMSRKSLVISYTRGLYLFQEPYLKATSIICETFRLFAAKPELRATLEHFRLPAE